MPNKELQELLSARFEGYTHSTDEAVWNTIESQLNKEKSDRAGIWFWIFNGIAATTLVGMMFQSQLNTENSLSTNQITNTDNSITLKVNKKDADNQSTNTNQVGTNQVNTDNSTKENLVVNSDKSISKSTEVVIAKATPKSENTRITQATQNSAAKMEFPNPIAKNETGQVDYSKLPTRLFDNSLYTNGISNILLETSNKKGRYLKELPIHIGFELTHLHRGKYFNHFENIPDWSYASINDQLATARKFEFSIFSQFDFTRKFSASIGVGYSSSKYNFADSSTPIGLSNLPSNIESQLELLTIPIQTKITFLQKNRLGLNAGITFQGEFGRILHTETIESETWTTITTMSNQSLESSETTKETIRQFAFEPFVQVSFGISSRLNIFTNLGCKSYFYHYSSGNTLINRRQYFNADVGIQFRIH